MSPYSSSDGFPDHVGVRDSHQNAPMAMEFVQTTVEWVQLLPDLKQYLCPFAKIWCFG